MAIDGGKSAPARKVMVIADATRESAAALQYTLSHAILENDTLILLHVENNNFWRNTFSFFRKPLPTNQIAASITESAAGSGGGGSGWVDLSFLEAMKQVCEKAESKIQVTTEVVEMDGKDKANVILSQCTEHKIDLLIIGQRRSLSNAILG